MDEFMEFLSNTFGLHDAAKAELINKELLNINPLYTASGAAFLSTLIKFVRVAGESTSETSVEKMLDIFYQANLSFIKDPKIKDIMSLIKSYGESKTYKTKCLEDMEKLLNLIEDNSEDIISKWCPDNDDNVKSQDILNKVREMEILFKVYAAVCALREIAYMRTRPNDEYDITMLQRITRIVMYSIGQMSKMDNPLLNPVMQNIIAAAKGSENISKRWEPEKKIKEESIKIANELWGQGEKKLHNDLATTIYRKIKNNYSQLTNDIAKKYSTNPKILKKILELKKFDEIEKLNDIEKLNEHKKLAESEMLTELEQLPDDEKLAKIEKLSESDQLSYHKNLKKCKDYADKYLIKTIRTAIIPVAEKYDRVHGTKSKIK